MASNRVADARPSGTDVAMELATWGTGLGVITFALFPFLIPGLAIVALFALPLLPLVLIVPLVWLPVWLVRAARRRSGRRRTRQVAATPREARPHGAR